MKKTFSLTIFTLAVVSAFVIAACTKRESASPEEQMPALIRNDLSNAQDGITGISGCYRKFAETLKNPPADYIPGDAQIALADCMRGFIHLGHPGSNIKYLPPPDPTPGTKIYPPVPNQDGVLLGVLGLSGYRLPSFYVNSPDYAAIVQKFADAKVRFRRAADKLCEMTTGAEAYFGGLFQDPESRADQIVFYAANNEGLFPPGAQDVEDALSLAVWIGSYEKFTISFALAVQFGVNERPLFPPPGFVPFPSACIKIRVAPAVINP